MATEGVTPSAEDAESPASSFTDGGASKDVCQRNVRMMLIYSFSGAIAYGVALGPVFDKYLYYLGGGAAVGPTFTPKHARNSLVGMTTSVSGLSSLFLAIPVGILVDMFPAQRARLLKYSSAFAVAASFLIVCACITDIVLLLYLALALLGVYAELASSSSEAIFADSIPQGTRSRLFTTKQILSTVGAACGPLFSAVSLLVVGNEWEPYQMKCVIIVGAILFPLTCAPLAFFSDPPAAGAGASPTASAQESTSQSQDGECAAAATADAGPSESAPVAAVGRRFGPLRAKHIPLLLALSDFISCIGAGMTVKFFNLFFIQQEKFTPVQICVLNTAYPLVIAACMKVTQGLSERIGRAQASFSFFSSNVLCLALLSQLTNLPFLVFVFLIRGGLANSTYPLDRSILMDFTPSSQRGKWNAVESLTSMTWSGSAFLGGILSDSHDYRYTFLITAGVYATSCLCYAPLMALVPRKESAVVSGEGEDPRRVPLAASSAEGGEAATCAS